MLEQMLIDYIHMHMGSITAFIVLFFLSCIEVSKIKLNPISAFFKWLGKVCNADLYAKMDELEKNQLKITEEFDTTRSIMKDRFEEIDKQQKEVFTKYGEDLACSIAMTSRYRVIRAADELREGRDLSHDHVEQLGEDIEVYKRYCEMHPMYTNHKGVVSMKMVEDYEKKLNASYSPDDLLQNLDV